MSVSCGPIDPEDLLEYLPHGAERIELAALHLVEQPAQFGVVGDGVLQVALRARGGDGEHLAREVVTTPLVELSGVDQMQAVLGDLLPELGPALVPRRLCEDDRRTPLAVPVGRAEPA